MFEGHAGLSMTGDHLDISYADPETWPKLTPSGSIRAFIFHLGDPEVGPCIQLGLIRPVAGERLDWRHSIDPLHHHGSDQFRTIVSGSWNLAGRRLAAGDYAFQESGIVYQEHPGPGGEGSTMLIMADRRGNQATIARRGDVDTIFEYDDVYGAPKPGQAYAHPAGDRGVAAVNTSTGRCDKGYLRGAIGDVPGSASGVLTGVLGDVEAGPVVHVLRCLPHETLMPAATWSTEILLLVVEGAIEIAGETKRAGELRVQRAGTAMGPVLAGGDGAQLVFVVADRRARPILAEAGAQCPDWVEAASGIASGAVPAVGGGPPAAERARRVSAAQ